MNRIKNYIFEMLYEYGKRLNLDGKVWAI